MEDGVRGAGANVEEERCTERAPSPSRGKTGSKHAPPWFRCTDPEKEGGRNLRLFGSNEASLREAAFLIIP